MKIEVIRKKRCLEPAERPQIKAEIGSFYTAIKIYFPRGKKLELSAEEAKEFKECLMRGKFCSFSKKSQSDEVIHYRDFYFHFDKKGVEIVLKEGVEYPTINPFESYETTFELSFADIPVVIALINEFLKSRKKFYDNEKKIEKELRNFFIEQEERIKLRIKKIAAKYNIPPSDISEIAERVKKQKQFLFLNFF